MTPRAKPRNPPTPEPRLEVPDTPIDLSRLPHGVSQVEAERMLADLLASEDLSWVAVPDLSGLPGHIQDLVSLAECGESWRADEQVRQHPRGTPASLVYDLKAVADRQLREYSRQCEADGRPADPAAMVMSTGVV